jgi:gliding motility-associated-like protein
MSKHLQRNIFGLLLGVLLTGLGIPAQAQREYFNWYFGDKAGLSFLAASPQPSILLDNKIQFAQGVASMSDATGRFIFSSDGYTVWDRFWQPMPGRNISQTLKYYGSNARQVMAVPQPSHPNRYYVLASQREFYNDEYPVSGNTPLFMPYMVVDMSARNGLGALVAHDSLQLPALTLHVRVPIQGLISNWAAVRHSNGLDLWLVGLTTEGQYVSWLLSATGLDPTPVVSLQPRWIGNNGVLKVSPDGRTVASLINVREPRAARIYGQMELADFDPGTGLVSNAKLLPTRFMGSGWYMNGNGSGGGILSRLAGLEFSPDGSRLYADSAGRNTLQYNLLAGSAQAIDASRVPIVPLVPGIGAYVTDMKLAPDGRIYLTYGGNRMGCIEQPNALGNACQLRIGQPDLQTGTATAISTLPLSPNDLNLPPVVVTNAGNIAAGSVCPGLPVPFMSSLSPFVTAAAYAWDFGDPASGSRNTAAGQAPVHVYQQSGRYTVTLRVTSINGQQFTTTQTVAVLPAPVVSLGPDLTLCADENHILSPGPQPVGSTYRWQDGSTGPSYPVTEAGTYRVTVTGPGGCVASDELEVTIKDCPNLPNIITPNQDGNNDTFVLRGLNPSDWTIDLYNRWGQQVHHASRYNNTWNAAGLPDGTYYYHLINRVSKQQLRGWFQVVR